MFFCLSQRSQQLELRLQISPSHFILNIADLKGCFYCGEFSAFVEVGVGEFKLLKLTQLHVSIIEVSKIKGKLPRARVRTRRNWRHLMENGRI